MAHFPCLLGQPFVRDTMHAVGEFVAIKTLDLLFNTC